MPDNPARERLQAALAGRYRIERELGTGGMATVYLAEDVRLSRRVALKVLKPELADSLSAERFPREIEVSARLEHPHIVPVYDSGDADGALYYTMPFVEGRTLRDRLEREGPLPIDEAVQITRDVAAALAFAHTRGVIHRDIKPANILLHEGHSLVADFGVASAVTAAGGERLTRTGVAVGSPLYMSPEQATGGAVVDGRSDQYGLACVLYEMLAGEPPFGGRSLQSILARRMTEKPTSLRSIRSSVSPELEAVVFRALDRTPADRYPSVAAFADALAEAAEASPTAAVSGHVRAPGKRRSLARISAAAVGVLLLLTAIRFGWFGSRAGPTAAEAAIIPGVAVLPFDFVGPDSAQRWVADAAAMKIVEAFRQTGVPSPGWNAVKRYSGSVPELNEVGQSLRVSYVLQGNVLYHVDGLELFFELTRIEDSRVIWSRSFNGLTADLAEVELEIAQTTVDSVAKYAGFPKGRLVVLRYTDDPVADSLYSRALFLSNQEYDPVSWHEMVDLASEAIKQDPGFAPAYVLKAIGLADLSGIAWEVLPVEQAPRIRDLLEKALEIDSDYAWARAHLGAYYNAFEWDRRASLEMLDRAIELDANTAEAWVLRSFPLVSTGSADSAVASVRHASELEPNNPLFISTECWILYLAHRYGEAIDRCQYVIDNISSDHPAAIAIRQSAEFAMRFIDGNPTEAQKDAAARELLESMPPVEERTLANEIGEPVKLAMLGRRDDALRVLREEIPEPHFRPLRAATAYAWLGDMDEAWRWLERAYDERDPNLAACNVRPEMKPFRSDPRWPDFLARMNLD